MQLKVLPAGMMLALALAAVPAASARQAPPQVRCAAAPVPPGSRLTLVAQRIALDGLPLSIVQAASPLPVTAFLQFFARYWVTPQGKPLYVRYPLGPWQVIAHGAGACFYTVQAQPLGAGTTALIGVSMPQRSQSNAELIDITAPENARVITHMVSVDGGRRGNTWLLYTANSPDSVLTFYARALHAQGWAQVLQQASPGHTDVSSAMYTKGAANIGLVVQPLRNGTSITITEMTHEEASP